jgi:hypothetical protein
MEQIALCEKLKHVVYSINVIQSGHLVSSGSGVAINERGDLLTAAHVISGNLPPRDVDLHDLVVQAKSESTAFDNYSIVCCAISITIDQLKTPIVLDLALLKNNNSINDRQFLPISSIQPAHGINILMAGYSDEIELPFSFDKKIDFSLPYMKGHEGKMQEVMHMWLRLSVIKSGMIGRASAFNINDNTLTGFTMYIDNGMHSGASGGPVINEDGELIGIITQRAITSFSTRENPGLKVPSGSTLAISPHTMFDFYRYQNKEEYYCHLTRRSS